MLTDIECMLQVESLHMRTLTNSLQKDILKLVTIVPFVNSLENEVLLKLETMLKVNIFPTVFRTNAACVT